VQTAPLGPSGLSVTRIIAGAARAPIPVARGVDLLGEAWELGARAIDVSDLGAQEETAAERFLEDRQPDEVVILAGTGPDAGPERGTDLSPERIAAAVATGVRRLGRLDALWLRGSDAATPLEATLTALAEQIEAGRLTCWGAADIDVWRLEALLTAADRAVLPRPAFLRNRMSLLQRADQRDLLPLATGEALAVTPRAPFAGGRLTDRHVDAEERAAEAVAAGGRRTGEADPALGGLVRLRDLARERSVSSAALALAWLTGHPAVTGVIVAPRALAEVDVVREAEGIDLDDEERERVDAIVFAAA
jgi:aryl-alcohol dehydrogenase-like predicted oxidoreductase